MEPEGELIPVKELFEFSSKRPGDEVLYRVRLDDTTVELYGGFIKRILPSMGLLTELTEIRIENNVLQAVPESFGELTKLTLVSFYRNQLSTLPESFGNLVQLRYLDLSHNSINHLPQSFVKLRRLQSLNLNSNQMHMIPASFGSLEKLTDLKFGKNWLTGIPDSLKGCTGLRSLVLSVNHMRGDLIFPHEWVSLEHLALRGCALQRLSGTITRLKRLERLDLGKNNLSDLPPMKELRHLLYLNLKDNPLKEIPRGLRQLSILCSLIVTNCQLTELPEWFGELRGLVSLDADQNEISELPECMGKMRQLRYLTIWNNNVKEIPKCVAVLPEILHLCVDPMRTFPPALHRERNTVQLYVFNNSNNDGIICKTSPKAMDHMPPGYEPQPLMVLAARRLGKMGTANLGSEDLPKPCLELVQTALECSTRGCKGVFVKGGGREAVVYERLKSGNTLPFYYTTCHPLCNAYRPRNWPQETEEDIAADQKSGPTRRGSKAQSSKWCALFNCILFFFQTVLAGAFQGWTRH